MGQVSNVVRIANPLPGGRAYTSRRSAEQFIRRGLAARRPDGAIHFVDQQERVPMTPPRIREFYDWRGDRVRLDLCANPARCDRDPIIRPGPSQARYFRFHLATLAAPRRS